MTFTDNLKKYKWPLVLLTTFGLALLISSYIVSERLQTFEATSRVQIAEQEALLSTIAETTARNGADSITESIVQDCQIDDRSRFDTLLGSLDNGLQRYELIELERLFDSCGSFYAERKAVMVARFAREIEVYESYVEHLSAITGKDEVEEYQVGAWKNLAAGEKTQSALFSSLVRLQKEIIDALLSGKTASSEEIVTILNEVRETREELLYTKTQTDGIRTGLTAL